MTTRSISESWFRDVIHDSALCLETENLECKNFEGPANHGSSTTVKVLGVWPSGGGKLRSGWKVRRNEASELRCLTVNDIFALLFTWWRRILFLLIS